MSNLGILLAKFRQSLEEVGHGRHDCRGRAFERSEDYLAERTQRTQGPGLAAAEVKQDEGDGDENEDGEDHATALDVPHGLGGVSAGRLVAGLGDEDLLERLELLHALA